MFTFTFTPLLALLRQFTGFFKSITHLSFIDTLETFSHAKGKTGRRSLNYEVPRTYIPYSSLQGHLTIEEGEPLDAP
jgi:hypothetical protein